MLVFVAECLALHMSAVLCCGLLQLAWRRCSSLTSEATGTSSSWGSGEDRSQKTTKGARSSPNSVVNQG
jgi:hypothetical protein